MSRRRPAGRSGINPVAWPSRSRLIVAALLGVVAALGAGAISTGLMAARIQPVQALALYPGLEPAAVRRADELLATARLKPDNRQKAEIRKLSLTAIRSTALTPRALRQLAMVTDDKAQATRLVSLSVQLSRRDPMALLMRAERTLSTGNVVAALDDLDRALRVSRRAGPTVFPLILGAGTTPQARDQLRILLAKDPPWGEALVSWSVDNPRTLPALAPLLSAFPDGSRSLAPGLGQQVVDQLAVQRQYAQAFAAYDAFASAPQNPSDMLREALRPIDWALIDNYEISARPTGEGRDVELRADGHRAGDVARLLTRFQPGPHRLTLRLAEAEGAGEISASVVCLTGQAERPVAQRTVPMRGPGLVLDVTVPNEGCPFQLTQISIAAADEDASVIIRAASYGALSGTRGTD